MSKNGSIYLIRNRVDGKVYVGSTLYGDRRANEHFCELKNNRHHNTHLQNAYNKYGSENFQFSIIVSNIPENGLYKKEEYYIKFFDSCNSDFGYNFNENPLRPRAPNKKQIIQIDPNTFKVVQEWDSILEAAYSLKENGKNASSSIGRACGRLDKVCEVYNYIWCFREDLEYRMDQLENGEFKSKKVLQYDLVGRFIKCWGTVKNAAESLNVSGHNIGSACEGRIHHSGGFQWRRFTPNYPKKIGFAKSKRLRPIVQFSKDGIRLNEFNSAQEVEEELGIKSNNIRTCCKNSKHYKICEGFQWRYLIDIPYGDITKVSNNRERSIEQLSKNGDIIFKWESIAEASRELGVTSVAILSACKGITKTSAGYKWRYADNG